MRLFISMIIIVLLVCPVSVHEANGDLCLTQECREKSDQRAEQSREIFFGIVVVALLYKIISAAFSENEPEQDVEQMKFKQDTQPKEPIETWSLNNCLAASISEIEEDLCYEKDRLKRENWHAMQQNSMGNLEELKDVLGEYKRCVKESPAYYTSEDCVDTYSEEIIKKIPSKRGEKIKRVKQTYCDPDELNMGGMIDCVDGKLDSLNREAQMIERCLDHLADKARQPDEACYDFVGETKL